LRILRQSTKTRPRLSLILLDWGVRESLHVLHYLKHQTIPQEAFEVVLVEYYDAISKPAKEFESSIDTWVLLEMPSDCYYHKHLMYNVGTVLSQAEILMFADSDAMVRPTFVETVLKAFHRDPLIVYHMDEFRNVRRDFYPFNYPSFEEVVGDGCVNNVNGKTKGILDDIDSMHTRNYGACMCGWRKDIIGVGGADEDLSYLGHICGPYDMTFRLMNFGRRLVWEADEYLYHTWHPGSDGIANYLGPHDGRNMSTTAFQALCSGRLRPLVENEAIRHLRTGVPVGDAGPGLRDLLINSSYAEDFNRFKLGGVVNRTVVAGSAPNSMCASYHGFDVYRINGLYYGVPPEMGPIDPVATEWHSDERVIVGHSLTEIRDVLDSSEARLQETVGVCNICSVGDRFAVVPCELGAVDFRVRRQRENPRIKWVNNLGEARKAATQFSSPAPANMDSRIDEQPALNRQVSLEEALKSDVTRLQLELSLLVTRVTTAERGLEAIYQSRTWRMLAAIGGFLQSTGKALGRRAR
jgi:hypothetical protein